MEVIGNNNHMKDTVPQSSGNNYSCHLPREMNFGSNSASKSKGEADVGLLVACKVQLSSEVIRWKTESLRLQKERDSFQQRTKDLNQAVAKLADRTRELEERLARAEDENQHLKRRSVTLDDPAILQKLSLNFNKYHSFPSSETSFKSSHHLQETRRSREILDPPEDLREVSQRLIDRMNEEVREMQEISCKYQTEDYNGKKCNLSNTFSNKIDSCCTAELEDDISVLLSQTSSLKKCLLEQNRGLKSLMQYVRSDEFPEDHSISNTDMLSSAALQLSAHSHRSSSEHSSPVRYKNASPKLNKLSKERQCAMRILQQEMAQMPVDSEQSPLTSTYVQNPDNTSEETKSSEDKICPICEDCFNTVPQSEFEEHVLNHLERESASLLDQYVIV